MQNPGNGQGPAPPPGAHNAAQYANAVRQSNYSNGNALRTMEKQSHYMRRNARLSQYGRANRSLGYAQQQEALRLQKLLEMQRAGQQLTIYGPGLDHMPVIAGLIQRAKQDKDRTKLLNMYRVQANTGSMGSYKIMFI